jgi:histidinol-phosphate aminotransferase
MAVREVSKDPASLVRDEVRALKAYHVSPAQGLVKLDAMENPYRLPEALAAEMGERLAQVAINRYPDPTVPELKQRLREAMAVPAGQEILLGNGSDEILQIISLALAKPGAVVLAPEPSFVMYRMSAVTAGMRYIGVPLREDFSLDKRVLFEAISAYRPALVWIAYPNNPSGNLFDRDAIVRIVEATPGLVAIDEAYYAFSGGATLMGELGRHPNLVVVRTVSKLGLAGLRLGCAIGPKEWLDEFEKLRLPYNVNGLSAAAGELLLAHRDVLEEQTRRIVADREALMATLPTIPGVKTFPSAANFILVRVPHGPRTFEALRARGILVRTFHGSHALLANTLRLTVGSPDENRRLVEALRSILS